jgi:alkylation response protein AidB-like acyl-CoA dehydrogenase
VNLLYTDTERALADALGDLLNDACQWQDVLDGRTSQDLWRSVGAELGCAGLLIPESAGGAGATCREAATAAEQLGSFVAPVPFLGSAVVATSALINVGGQDDLLKRLADGSLTVALVVPFGTAPGQTVSMSRSQRPIVADESSTTVGAGGSAGAASGPFAAARVSGARPGDAAEGVTRLSGTVRGVADALVAGVLLVPAEGVPRGLYAVDATAPGVTTTPVTSLDMTRQLADITLEAAPGRLIASGQAAEESVASALLAGAAIIAAEELGLAQRCLDMTVAYVKERRQFARPVGSFQGLKHRLADIWTEVTQARAASRYAADCLATGDPDARVAVALAKSYCSETAVHAAQECVQMHGGIGFTWEHPAHLYLKRAKANSIGFGTPAAHRATLATLAGLPAPG